MLPEEERKLELVPVHASEDAMELYVLNMLDADDLDALEGHLMVCQVCSRHLDEVEIRISHLKQALRELELRERMAEMQEKKNAGKIIMFRRPT